MRPQPKDFTKADYEALADFRYALRRFLHRTEDGARAAGLTPQQHQLLLAIKGRRGQEWAHVADLAEMLQITHHAAVRLTDRCERGGWVRRDGDPDDRRQVRVSLTLDGEDILRGLVHRNRRELQALRQALELPFLADGIASGNS